MYRVAIIGTGFGAKVHLPAFNLHPQFEVTHIAGRDPTKTAEIASAAGIEFTTDWRTLLHTDVDLISVSTPPYLHHEMGREVLLAGKHLLLEKPTTTTALQARELLQLAEEHSLVGMLSHEFRWMPERRLLTDVVQSQLGEITEIHATHFMSFANSPDVPPYGWLWNMQYDGGILGALGSHLIDQLRTTSGMEFTEVYGRLYTRTPLRRGRDGEYRKVTVDDGFLIDFTLENGAHGVMNATSTIASSPSSRVVYGGENGVAVQEGSEVYYAEKGQPFAKVEVPDSYLLPETDGDRRIRPYLPFLDEVAAALSEGVSHSPSLYDGWRNQLVLDAVRQSHSLGTRVRIF